MKHDPVYGIFGNIGGGTSAVAGVVKILGIPMKGQPKTLDDDLLHFSAPSFHILKERKGTWAFKHPLLTDYIEELHALIPNMKPIYVYRDPVAAAWRHTTKLNSPSLFEEHLERQRKMMEGPKGLHLSYERIIRDREKAVHQIAEYIDRPFNERAVEWLDPSKGYRRVSEYMV